MAQLSLHSLHRDPSLIDVAKHKARGLLALDDSLDILGSPTDYKDGSRRYTFAINWDKKQSQQHVSTISVVVNVPALICSANEEIIVNGVKYKRA